MIELDNEGNVISTSGFDHVFDGACETRQIYEEVASSMVESALEGYNGTLFAYGIFSSHTSIHQHIFLTYFYKVKLRVVRRIL